MYKAVIFDLDGTLLDTLKDLTDSVNVSLNKLGFPGHNRDYYTQFMSAGIETMAELALPEEHRNELVVNKMVEHIDKDYSKRWMNNSLPYRGISELLKALPERNVKMAVLSNTSHNLCQLMVSKLLADEHFEIIVGARPSIAKKPDPSAALNIALRLNIIPEEFLFLGDSDIDIKTAVAAGMYPVGALWGFGSTETLALSGANKLIKHPAELLEIL